MKYYPLLLDLRGKTCIVVGSGIVGERKINSLLACVPDKIYIFDIYKQIDLPISKNTEIIFVDRGAEKNDFANADLVFACTSSKIYNGQIAAWCSELKILCNIVDNPELGNFIVPAHFWQGEILICIATLGKSPALAKRIRQDIERNIGEEYAKLCVILARLRPKLLELNLGTEKNTEIFRSIVFSDILQFLRAKDINASVQVLEQNIPLSLHHIIREFIL